MVVQVVQLLQSTTVNWWSIHMYESQRAVTKAQPLDAPVRAFQVVICLDVFAMTILSTIGAVFRDLAS